MAFINYSAREINCKLVYYGPGLCGKTTNLKQIYLQRRELEAALACCDRSLLLEPESAVDLRDRGLVHQALECFGAAAQDLERFLLLAPSHESAGQIQAVLSTLRERASKLH